MPAGTQDPNARQVLARIGIAPSPASSGTDFHVDATVDYFQNEFEQQVPFKITVYPSNELPTKTNSEVVLVTAYTASTRTGGVVVQEVQPGHTGQGSIDIQETQPGDPTLGQDEIQTLTVDATGGTYTLSFGGYTTAPLAYNASASTIQTALQGLTSIGSGNVSVTQLSVVGHVLLSDGTSRVLLADGSSIVDLAGTPDGNVYTITFQGALANTAEDLITAASSLTAGGAGTVTVVELIPGSGLGDEVQQVSLSDEVADGDFTLSFGGYTTNPMVCTITADSLSYELHALTSIGTGNVEVEGAAGGPWNVSFTGTLANSLQALLTGDATLLSDAGLASQQTVGIDASGGTFRLSADGGSNYTSALAYNASASTVQTALQGLAAVGSGNCSVDYDSVSGIYTVTWTGALANSEQALLTADASSLTLATYHVTGSVRQQDNTNARTILVGDMVEAVAQVGGEPRYLSFTIGGGLTPDPTLHQIYAITLHGTLGGTLVVGAPSPEQPMATAQMTLITHIMNTDTNPWTLSWDAVYAFGGLTKKTSLASGAGVSYVFGWNGTNWNAVSYNTF